MLVFLGYLQLNDPSSVEYVHSKISNFLHLILSQKCESDSNVNHVSKSLNLISLKMTQMTQMFKNGKFFFHEP